MVQRFGTQFYILQIFTVEQAAVEQMSIKVNGEQIYGNRLQGVGENKSYQVEVLVPKTAAQQNAVMEAV